MPVPRASELPGYPADARLLILNADDPGMRQGINDAVGLTPTQGVVGSTTLVALCQQVRRPS